MPGGDDRTEGDGYVQQEEYERKQPRRRNLEEENEDKGSSNRKKRQRFQHGHESSSSLNSSPGTAGVAQARVVTVVAPVAGSSLDYRGTNGSTSDDAETPATTLLDLTDDSFVEIFRCVGPGSFRYVTSVCKQFHRLYCKSLLPATEQSKSGPGFKVKGKKKGDEGEENKVEENIIPPEMKTTYLSSVVESISRCQYFLADAARLYRTERLATMIARSAASKGSIPIFNFIWELSKNTHTKSVRFMQKDHMVCQNAARHGHIDFLKYVNQDDIKCIRTESTCSAAAGCGQLTTLQWLHETKCAWDSWTCGNAINGGHLAVFKYARENACPFSETAACNAAAGKGRLEMLKYLRETCNCSWGKMACTVAAANGHLNVLQYLRWNACPWDSTTLRASLKHGHTEVYEWAKRNGCPE